jgi:hypothetical protein
MNDFNESRFAAASFFVIGGVVATAMSYVRTPADIADECRLIQHEIMQSNLARGRARISYRAGEAEIEDIDASAALRRAAQSARVS